MNTKSFALACRVSTVTRSDVSSLAENFCRRKLLAEVAPGAVAWLQNAISSFGRRRLAGKCSQRERALAPRGEFGMIKA